MKNQRCWLFTEIADENRITQGNAGYDDETGVIYRYDNSVPNHKNPAEGDLVVLRRGGEVLGTAIICEIKSSAGEKERRRCPECGKTKVRFRKTISPPWRCMDCRVDFLDPNIVNESAELYEAHFNETFKQVLRRIPLSSIWANTVKINKQHSIQELDMHGIGEFIDLPSGYSLSGKKGYQRLPSSELSKVRADHIWNAVNKLLDGFEDHSFAPSTDYDILTDCGTLLPPKAVFGLAASEALGFKVEPKHFSGGLETTCFTILKQSGFNIVRKRGNETASPRIPIPPEDREWSEGNRRRVSHLQRERASGLSQAKKDHFRREHGKLFCQRCGLDPVSSYEGLHGEACIEAHHMDTSVARMGEGHKTRLEDLQCLCANCHRVIHRLQA
jgi:hypothetical protein